MNTLISHSFDNQIWGSSFHTILKIDLIFLYTSFFFIFYGNIIETFKQWIFLDTRLYTYEV